MSPGVSAHFTAKCAGHQDMANFESLPEEIVTCIAQYTPAESLAALAKVSKKLNRCSTPLLYQYVHLWENKDLEDGEEVYSWCMTIPSSQM